MKKRDREDGLLLLLFKKGPAELLLSLFTSLEDEKLPFYL